MYDFDCLFNTLKFPESANPSDIAYKIGKEAKHFPAIPIERKYSYSNCDVIYTLKEDWVNPPNYNRGNAAISDYIHDYNPYDGTFNVYTTDNDLIGTTYWMKLTVEDSQFDSNADFLQFKIIFGESSNNPCENVVLSNPVFDQSLPDCY